MILSPRLGDQCVGPGVRRSDKMVGGRSSCRHVGRGYRWVAPPRCRTGIGLQINGLILDKFRIKIGTGCCSSGFGGLGCLKLGRQCGLSWFLVIVKSCRKKKVKRVMELRGGTGVESDLNMVGKGKGCGKVRV